MTRRPGQCVLRARILTIVEEEEEVKKSGLSFSVLFLGHSYHLQTESVRVSVLLFVEIKSSNYIRTDFLSLRRKMMMTTMMM